MTTEKPYFGNTITAEEAELLATLPPAEAAALHKEIAARTAKTFPAVSKRMSGGADELLGAIVAGDQEPQVDPKLGTRDLTAEESELEDLLKANGF